MHINKNNLVTVYIDVETFHAIKYLSEFIVIETYTHPTSISLTSFVVAFQYSQKIIAFILQKYGMTYTKYSAT